jgi:hypothetical protein
LYVPFDLIHHQKQIYKGSMLTPNVVLF